MSAVLDAPVIPVPVRPRRRADRGAHAAPRLQAPSAQRPRDASWAYVPAPTACEHVAPVVPLRPLEVAPSLAPVVALPLPQVVRYEWTPRGLAVLMSAVAAVCLLMLGTLVSSYLSVSDAPIETGVASVQAR